MELNLDVAHLSCGRHTLHYRIFDQQGKYSSVHSHSFFHLAHSAQRQFVLHYWFDHNAQSTAQVRLTEGEAVTLSVSHLKEGRHTLHYFVEHGVASRSATVNHSFWYQHDAPLRVRYWLTGSTPQEATVDELNANGFRLELPKAVRREVLNYCLVRGGKLRSAIHQRSVLRFPHTYEDGLRPTLVQYVVDNDLNTVHTVDISASPFTHGILDFALPIETTEGEHNVTFALTNCAGVPSAWGTTAMAQFTDAQGRLTVHIEKPAHGYLEVRANGQLVMNGMRLERGTRLTLRPVPDRYYEATAIYVNGQPFESTELTLTVPITLTADFQIIDGVEQVSDPDFALHMSKDGNTLLLTLPTALQQASIRLYGIDGRCHQTQTAQGSVAQLNVSTLPAGVYVLRVGSRSVKWTKR